LLRFTRFQRGSGVDRRGGGPRDSALRLEDQPLLTHTNGPAVNRAAAASRLTCQKTTYSVEIPIEFIKRLSSPCGAAQWWR